MKKKVKADENVFEALGFSKVESEKLKIKSDLMVAIRKHIEDNHLTQEQAAKLMHVSRPRISDAVRGRHDKFTIDALIDMLSQVGHHIILKVAA